MHLGLLLGDIMMFTLPSRVTCGACVCQTGGLKHFRLFGDKAYQGFGDDVLHPYLAPQSGTYEAWFNTKTSAYRIEVEHNIGNIYMQCAVLQNEMKIETQLPELWFQASVFIHNVHSCVMHSNQTAIRFGNWNASVVPCPLSVLGIKLHVNNFKWFY